MTIVANRLKILESVEKSRRLSPLASPTITLLAASKGQSAPTIEATIHAGIVDFGENRVQETQAKWPELKQRHPHIRLHLIGPLQTNKVKDALALFNVIQTLDREKLAKVMSHELWVMSQNQSHDSQPMTHDFYIQINTGEEPQKAGIAPKDADAFICFCRDELKLPIVGLMCIPPANQPSAPHFALLREIAKRNNLRELSMGMSGDFETAVRMGSSCVRIGTALFGERK